MKERERLKSNEWLWKYPSTPEQVDEAYEEMSEGIKREEFTCNKCHKVTKCSMAFDSYNQRGDCLLEK